MSTTRTSDDGSAPKRAESAGRTLPAIALTLVLVLIGVVVLGVLGVVGPGMLTIGQAFFVLGAGMTAVAGAVVWMAMSLRDSLRTQQALQAQIDAAQDASIGQDGSTAVGPQGLDEELAQTRSELEGRIASLEAQISSMSDRLEGGAQASSMEPSRSRENPFGDIHPVLDVEGIGGTYEAALANLGIEDTEQLWQADAEEVARELEVPVKTVRGWQAMTELMALQHVGPQYAELLVRSGIMSIDQLAQADPEEVAARLQQLEGDREVRIQGNLISAKHTGRWIQAAKDHGPQAPRTHR